MRSDGMQDTCGAGRAGGGLLLVWPSSSPLTGGSHQYWVSGGGLTSGCGPGPASSRSSRARAGLAGGSGPGSAHLWSSSRQPCSLKQQTGGSSCLKHWNCNLTSGPVRRSPRCCGTRGRGRWGGRGWKRSTCCGARAGAGRAASPWSLPLPGRGRGIYPPSPRPSSQLHYSTHPRLTSLKTVLFSIISNNKICVLTPQM